MTATPVEQSPVIKLTCSESRKAQLRLKLEEYKGRREEFFQGNPFRAPEALDSDTMYKIAVLEALLETGEVETWELSRELSREFGFLNGHDFNRACLVIEDYVMTGGENLSGGTSLPPASEAPTEILS